MNLNQLPPQPRIARLFRRVELPLRQRNPHLRRDRPHRLRKRDRLHLHHEAEHVPMLMAPKAVITRRPRIQIKRPRLLLMKRTKRRPVRPRLPQLHILAHNPDDVGLLLHGLRKTVGHRRSLQCRRSPPSKFPLANFVVCMYTMYKRMRNTISPSSYLETSHL